MRWRRIRGVWPMASRMFLYFISGHLSPKACCPEGWRYTKHWVFGGEGSVPCGRAPLCLKAAESATTGVQCGNTRRGGHEASAHFFGNAVGAHRGLLARGARGQGGARVGDNRDRPRREDRGSGQPL